MENFVLYTRNIIEVRQCNIPWSMRAVSGNTQETYITTRYLIRGTEKMIQKKGILVEYCCLRRNQGVQDLVDLTIKM